MKKIFLLMFSLLIFVNPFLNVKAEEPEDEIIVEEYLNKGILTFSNLHNNYILYGLDAYSGNGFRDSFITSKKEETDYGIRYILDNGYPNKNITDNNDVDLILTKLAILWYMIDMEYVDINGKYSGIYNEYSLNYFKEDYEQYCTNGQWTESTCPTIQHLIQYFESDDNILNKALELQKEYEKNYTGEIILSDSSSKLTKSEGGKYYETNWLSVKRSDANKYNIELTNAPKGTIIIDKDGNEKTEFNITDEFKIKVPVDNVKDSQISFKINIDDTYNTYYIYKSNNTDLSRGGPLSYKTLSLDDGYANQVYSKPYPKQIKESKEFYLDIDAEIPSQIVIVPPTSAYASVIIAILGIICVIISIFVMRKIIKKES